MNTNNYAVALYRRIVSRLHASVNTTGTFWVVLAIVLPSLFCKPTSAETIESATCAPQGSRPFCVFPKTVVNQCAALPSNSLFAQCNIFLLAIGQAATKQDDLGNSYASIVLKYSESNNCLTGTNDNFTLLGKCDTFAAYIQIIRHLRTGKCYALVNSALLGMQRKEEVFRNNPNKPVKKLEIQGIYRRITFMPTSSNLLEGQTNSVLIRPANSLRPYLRSGPTISALILLELENSLTIKRENLRLDSPKIRLTRGINTNTDFLDFRLNSREQRALYNVLLGCQ